MKTRVAILVMAAAAVIAVAIVVAPGPALSQGSPQPVSISVNDIYANAVFVLYDNGEVWNFDWPSGGPLDVAYPGAAAVEPTSWGKVKSEFKDD